MGLDARKTENMFIKDVFHPFIIVHRCHDKILFQCGLLNRYNGGLHASKADFGSVPICGN